MAGLLLALAVSGSLHAQPDPRAEAALAAAAKDQATPPNTWLPRGTAELQALDKVTARSAKLEVKVGSSAEYGSLTITVKSCVVRPPDQPQNAASFLVITDSHEGEPGFRGWIFSAEPSLSMLEHPIYDVRLLGCTT
jgi:hypothetical protein